MRACVLLAAALAQDTAPDVNWCAGSQVVYQTCNSELCAEDQGPEEPPVDAEFGEWNEWGECSCQFLKERSRPVKQHHQYNGKPISGTIIEAAACEPDLAACNILKPVDCEVGEWGSWDAACECGRTQIYRKRQVTSQPANCGATCSHLALNETKACPQDGCTESIDCKLTEWSEWDTCTVTCGGGQQQRTRYVEKYPSNGGKECTDVLIETAGCNTECCDDKKPVDCAWGGWSEWSACTAECDGGERTRQRMLETPPRNGGAWCPEGSVREVEGCNTEPCNPKSPVNGAWAEWGEWGPCSASCGGGYQWRSRTVAVAAQHGGTPATGEFQDFQTCSPEKCVNEDKKDCEFGPWTAWGGCSMACNGFQSKSREITQHAVNGGAICEGSLRLIEPCNVDSDICKIKTPKPCEWNEWGEWEGCSASCGGGTQARERSVKKDQEYSGEGCEGVMKEIKSCETESCNPELDKDVDCEWNEWSEWGACSRTCGGGQKQRWRGVKVPAKNDGAVCKAQDSLEVAPCHLEGCGTLTYCTWSEWEMWGECSKSCGSGERFRKRALGTTQTAPAGEALATTRFWALGAIGAEPATSVVAAMGGALLGVAALSLYYGGRRGAVDEAAEPLVE